MLKNLKSASIAHKKIVVTILLLMLGITSVFAVGQWYYSHYFHGTVKASTSNIDMIDIDFGTLEANTQFSNVTGTATIHVRGNGTLRITNMYLYLPKGCSATTEEAMYNLQFDYKLDGVIKCNGIWIVHEGDFSDRYASSGYKIWYWRGSNSTHDWYEYYDNGNHWIPVTLSVGDHTMEMIFYGKTGNPTVDSEVKVWFQILLEP